MNNIQELIDFISTLPGLGPRSAKRIFFSMIRDKKRMMYKFADILKSAANSIVTCQQCGNFDISTPCKICSSNSRDNSKLCIITEISDLWNVEESGHYDGYYFCLGGVLSSSFGSSNNIDLEKLFNIILEKKHNLKEIIIATNATIENQTTAFFLIDNLKNFINKNSYNFLVTMLGKGIPVGSELDYLDEGTIGAAFRNRKEI